MSEKIKKLIQDKNKFFSLIIVAVAFAIFFIFYLDNNILGDQVGLWSYISNHENQNPFALWNWAGGGGTPHTLNPEYSFLEFSYFINILVKDITLRANIINAIHAVILFVGMFLLCNHLRKNFNASLIGAMVALFSGNAIRNIGNNPYYFALAYVPFIFYFTIKLLEEPKYIYSFALAVSFTLLVLSGGISTLLWLIFYLPIFFLLYFAFFFDKNKLQKQIIFLVIAFILFVLFSLFKIWGGYVYMQDTGARSSAQPYELFMQGIGAPQELVPKIFSIIIPAQTYDHIGLWLGPIGILLILFSIPNFKKRKYLLFALIMVISILVVSDTIFTTMAHKIPFLNRLKDVVKSLFIFSISAGVIASFGYTSIEKFLKNELKFLPQIVLSLLVIQFSLFFIIFPNPTALTKESNVNKF
ncbi:MAG: hypothetical protein QW331_04385, partial [Candidatus Woesearchaeota archaeon]